MSNRKLRFAMTLATASIVVMAAIATTSLWCELSLQIIYSQAALPPSTIGATQMEGILVRFLWGEVQVTREWFTIPNGKNIEFNAFPLKFGFSSYMFGVDKANGLLGKTLRLNLFITLAANMVLLFTMFFRARSSRNGFSIESQADLTPRGFKF